MKKALLIAALTLSTLTVLGKTLKTVVYTTNPKMHCENCEKRIKGNIRFVKGVKQITTNVDEQTVTVEYDADKTSPEEIEKGFKKIGYEVKQVSTDKKQK